MAVPCLHTAHDDDDDDNQDDIDDADDDVDDDDDDADDDDTRTRTRECNKHREIHNLQGRMIGCVVHWSGVDK